MHTKTYGMWPELYSEEIFNTLSVLFLKKKGNKRTGHST